MSTTISRGQKQHATVTPAIEALEPPAPDPPARDLPGPKLLMVVRRNSLLAWPMRAYRELLVHRRFLHTDCFLVSDPAAARHVLSEAGATYARPVAARRLIRPVARGGVAIAEGDEWRERRRLISTGFTPRHVDTLIPRFAAAADGMLASLSGQTRAQLGIALEHAAIDAAGLAIFSLSLAARAEQVSALLQSYLRRAARAQIFDFLARSESDFPWFTWRRAQFSRRLYKEIDRLVALRQQTVTTPREGQDFYAVLAASVQSSGEPLTMADIRHELASMLTAGSETTSRLMFWTAYLLARSPAWQDAVSAELQSFPPTQLTSIRDLDRWPSLRSVILEALRLYPPTSVISRVPISTDTLLGTTIRPGSLIMVSPWIMHRHEQLWDDPRVFRPERFGGDPRAWLSMPAYMPFGAGARSCPGGAFAMTEASIMIAHLLARFEITVETQRPAMPVAIVATVPDHDPWFHLRPR